MGDELRYEDPERPDVGLDAEAVIERGFGGRPLDGEFRPLSRGVLAVDDHSSETEIGNLDDVPLAHQDVSGGEVPMDVVLGL